MFPQPPEITEFFGAFLAYSEIMEKSHMFGKFPLHWDVTACRLVLDLDFSRDYKVLIRLGTFFIAFTIPGIGILLRSLSNKLGFFSHFKDSVPQDVIALYAVAFVVFLGIFALFSPILFIWKIYTEDEIERSFVMFQRLSRGNFNYNFIRVRALHTPHFIPQIFFY